MPIEIVVPSAGESISEVQIGDWLKPDGDFVKADELVVEIETDKGHDAFLLDEPELHNTLTGFLDGAAERRGLNHR